MNQPAIPKRSILQIPLDKTDPPTGLFQLNHLYEERYWRSSPGGNECKFPEGNTKPVKKHIDCSLRIMYDLIKKPRGRYQGTCKIFPNKSYWQNLTMEYPRRGGDLGEKHTPLRAMWCQGNPLSNRGFQKSF